MFTAAELTTRTGCPATEETNLDKSTSLGIEPICVVIEPVEEQVLNMPLASMSTA